MTMTKAMLSATAVLLLSGCTVYPEATMPSATIRDGLWLGDPWVERGLRGMDRIGGLAQNVSGKDIANCFITFDLIDSLGHKVGEAIASTSGLKRGQYWSYRTTAVAYLASSIVPKRVAEVRYGSVATYSR